MGQPLTTIAIIAKSLPLLFHFLPIRYGICTLQPFVFDRLGAVCVEVAYYVCLLVVDLNSVLGPFHALNTGFFLAIVGS